MYVIWDTLVKSNFTYKRDTIFLFIFGGVGFACLSACVFQLGLVDIINGQLWGARGHLKYKMTQKRKTAS